MHVRCPHCHQPVELVDNTGLEHIDCPSCGSHFSLLGDQTASYDSGEVRTIGHFELIERLGMGQFGTVWMARDTELDRTVAVKIPRQEQLSRDDAEMFLREARAAAQLHHPNIVSVHEVGREGDTVYIVSDLVRGVTLADRLTAGRLSPRESAQLCVTIAEALEHAHQAGVVHRDLKPSNIMIDAEGQPHLMDFGLAKREAAEITMTMDGRILGTPAYMSPEQARGEAHQADARSDIYSLGTILFELLTGELPFRGNKRMLMMQIIHDEPPSPRKLDAAVPRDLETICLKCLEKSPDRRYATASNLADELRRYLAGQPIHARPVGRVERSWRWCLRNPLVAALAASVVAALLTGAGVSTYFAIEERTAKFAAEQAAESEGQQTIAAKAQRDRADREAGAAVAARKAADAERFKAVQAADEARKNAEVVVKQEAVLRSRLAQQYLERGAKLCAAGDRHSGMLSLMRAFDAVGPEHPARSSARRLLAGWCAEPDLTLYHPATVKMARIAAGADRIVTSCADNTCLVWDASTGRLVAGPLACNDGTYQISPAGNFIVIPSPSTAKPEFTVCDLSTGNSIWQYTGLRRLQFSADDRLLIYAEQDVDHDRVKIVDPKTGKEGGAPISVAGRVHRLLLDADGKRALVGEAAGDYERLRIFDLQKGESIGRAVELSDELSAVHVSFERNRVLTQYEGTVHLWNLDDGTEVGNPVPLGDTGGATLRKDGAVAIVTAPWQDGKSQVRFFDALTGEERGAVPVSRSVSGVSGAAGRLTTSVTWLSPNEKLTAVKTGDSKVCIVDSSTAQPACSEIALDGVFRSVTWCADNRLLATTSITFTPAPAASRRQGQVVAPRYEIRVWNAESGKPIGEAIHASGINAATAWGFTRDAKRLVIALSKSVQMWSVPPGDIPEQELASAFGPRSFVPERDAVLLMSDDRTVHFRPLVVSQPAERLHWGPTVFKRVHALAVNPQGTRIYSASDDWTCKKWNVNSQLLVGKPLQHGGAVRAVAVSRDGRLVATGSSDRSARLWEASTNKQVAGPFWHSQAVTAVAFLPDASCLVTACEDGTATIWNTATGMRVGRAMKHAKAVRSLSVSPDGSCIVTGSDDETARVWDAATGEPLCEPLRHESAVNVVQFCPDGKRFLSASMSLHQWDARTATEVSDPMDHGAGIACAAYSPDGELIVSADDNHTLRVWDAASAQMAGPAMTLSHLAVNIAFHPRGDEFFTAGNDGWIRICKAPSVLDDDADRLRAWAEVVTTKNTSTPMERLSFASWSERQRQLLDQGGAPRTTWLQLDESWASENIYQPPLLCSNIEAAEQRLKTILVAMHKFADARRAFPAAANYDSKGKPCLSWRVDLLPFLGEQKLYDQFRRDEPWNSEHNLKLIAEMPGVYRDSWSSAAGEGKTCLVVPVGPGTCFDSTEGRRITQITDGAARTVILAAVNAAHSVIWTKPDDLDLRTTDALEALRGVVPGQCLLGFADGHVELMPCELPEEIFPRALFMAHFTCAAGELVAQTGMPDAQMVEQYRGKMHPLDELRIRSTQTKR